MQRAAKFLVVFVFEFLAALAASAQVQSGGWEFHPPQIPANISAISSLGDVNYISASSWYPSVSRSELNSDLKDQSAEDIRGITSETIGNTYFDLQTNGSICHTFFCRDDGSMYAVWNFAPQIDPDLTLRGTGFNYFNNTWQPPPVSRIESSVTGWPNIAVPSSDQTLILTHNQTYGHLEMLSEPANGSGTWTEIQDVLPSPSPYGNWWPRMTVGGVNNNFVYAISLTLPVSHGGTIYNGQDGALLFSKSTDNGETWSVINQPLPAIDSTEYYRIRPDNYAIDAYQNIVAIVTGGFGNDLVLLQSSDFGASWQHSIIQKFPIDRFNDQVTDVDGDGTADWVDSNDGSLSVLIDDGGKIHVWAGYVRMINTDSTDHTLSFYSSSNGIWYWNSYMAAQPPKIITGAIDKNNNGILDINGYGTFNAGLATHPCGGTDLYQNIWLSYSAIVEDGIDASGKNVRHTYLMGSYDGGNNWGPPYDIVNDQNAEGIYACIARKSNDNIRLVYQKDYCAGISTTYGNPDACNSGELNSIIYVEASPSEILGTNELASCSEDALVYPNPSNGLIHFSLGNRAVLKTNITIRDATGIIMKQYADLVYNGTLMLDLSDLPGGIYFMTIQSDQFMITKKVSIAK